MLFLRELNKFLDKITEPFSILLYAGTLLLAGLQVSLRYLFDSSLYWAEEAMRYGFVWGTLLGICICHRKGVNIAIEAFTSKLKDSARERAAFMVHVLSGFFFCVLIIYGSKLVLVAMPQESAAMGIPMGLVYLSVPVSGLIMLLHTFERIFIYFCPIPDMK